ncbi:MAG TPA: ABC transporter permease [Bauldia sp.]|nr:ABC transporter permease [Bauldia sp.]
MSASETAVRPAIATPDGDEAPVPAARASRGERIARIAVPLTMLVLVLLGWHLYVTLANVPHYVLPSPVLVVQSLITDWPTLFKSLIITLKTTFSALGLALVGGVLLAVLMAQSRLIELAIYPYAVVLQVTPIIAVAPLILIYAPSTTVALLIVAFIVAFFPILSNTTQGIRSTDHNLLNLFELYGATPWQTLIHLKLPNALPYFLTGLKIAGGLSLIGAVVAEFTAGSAGANSGLAFRLLESQFRLNIPRLYAALLLLSFTGVLIFFASSLLSWLLLRKWHESAVRREN